MIIETYPEAAEIQRNGCNPLHVTLYKRNPISEDVLLMLIKAAPKAACVQDYDGNLPLHHAFHWTVRDFYI
jgi:ankyrin repeat protein